MAHRAALYSVRVKEKWRDYRPLGNIDEAGTWLGDVIHGWITDGFEQYSLSQEKVVRGLDASFDADDDLCMALQHGQNGVAADIVDELMRLQHRRTADESELLRCCCVLRLPRDQENGWLATHQNNGHSVKGLLERGLEDRFRRHLPDLKIEIKPIVRGAALLEAIQQGHVEGIKLVKLERPHDRANAATGKWMRAGDLGKLELHITSPGQRLQPRLLQRFIRGDRTALSEIVEFEGIEFDEVDVEVTLPEGTRRTFNLQSPDKGFAMSVNLDHLDLDADGEPSEASVYAGLKDALGSLG
jgi:hypothetical protein